ncbi:MAG: HAD hydrolase-like protein [Actinomycetota bacterium]|nr:HAD hydrolase-like protein [Actinomycetota bacterium]
MRDGFALTAAGAYAEFSDVAAESLRVALAGLDGLLRDVDEAIGFVLAGFPELDVHPDVPAGMRELQRAGIRLITMTNGSAPLSEGMLSRAGVLDLWERRMSVGEARRWKPAAEPYRYAAQCGVSQDQIALIAVHPWDIDGAQRAGLITGWINRKDRAYPQCFLPPDVMGSDLPAVADALLALGD